MNKYILLLLAFMLFALPTLAQKSAHVHDQNSIQSRNIFDVSRLKDDAQDGNDGHSLVPNSPTATRTTQYMVLTLNFV